MPPKDTEEFQKEVVEHGIRPMVQQIMQSDPKTRTELKDQLKDVAQQAMKVAKSDLDAGELSVPSYDVIKLVSDCCEEIANASDRGTSTDAGLAESVNQTTNQLSAELKSGTDTIMKLIQQATGKDDSAKQSVYIQQLNAFTSQMNQQQSTVQSTSSGLASAASSQAQTHTNALQMFTTFLTTLTQALQNFMRPR